MKPKNCTCDYPAVLLRNMNGHDPSCPVYQEWKKEYDRRSQMNPQVVMAISMLEDFTDAQRLEVFSAFCKHCGGNDPECQCWNDE